MSHTHTPAPGGTMRHCYVGSGDRTRWTATLREACACGARRLVHVTESVDRDGSPVAERDAQPWVDDIAALEAARDEFIRALARGWRGEARAALHRLQRLPAATSEDPRAVAVMRSVGEVAVYCIW